MILTLVPNSSKILTLLFFIGISLAPLFSIGRGLYLNKIFIFFTDNASINGFAVKKRQGIKTRVDPPTHFKAQTTRRVSTGAPAGSYKNAEGLRVRTEGVAPFDFSGQPPVAEALTRAPPASPPRLFSDTHGSRVIERSRPGDQADTRHHAHHAPTRGS